MTDGFSIRTATPEDAGPVRGLLNASYPTLMKSSYDPAILAAALPLMTQANPALLSSGTYYVAQNEAGDVVGCGGWTLERPGTGKVAPGLAHVRHFATHPDWIGRGVGRALFARCETDARAAAVDRFECYASLNAEGFYRSLGFTRVREMAVPMGPALTMPSLLMQRSI